MAIIPNEPEPVRWISSSEERATHKGNNVRGRERLPSVATTLDDHNRENVHPRAHSRYARVLKREGHLANVVLTCGAADLPDPRYPLLAHPHGTYIRMQTDKHRAAGAVFVDLGCIAAQLRDGRARRDHVVAKEILDAEPCESCTPETCPHLAKEIAARRDRQAAHMQQIEDEYRGKNPLAALVQRQTEMVSAMRDVFASAKKADDK